MYAPAHLLARRGTGFLRAIPRTLYDRDSRCIPSRKKTIQIERLRYHLEIAGWCARPLFTGPIPIELDAIAVGIAQVKRLAYAVIRGPVQRDRSTDVRMNRLAIAWSQDAFFNVVDIEEEFDLAHRLAELRNVSGEVFLHTFVQIAQA